MRALAGLVCAAIVLTGCSATTDAAQQNSTGAPQTRSIEASAAARTVHTWFSLLNPKIQRLEQSITLAQVAARRPGRGGLTAACHQIKIDVQRVRAAPKSSDRVVRAALSNEMRAFGRAADQCVAGNLDAAGRSLNSGHRYEEVVLRRLDILVPATRRSV